MRASRPDQPGQRYSEASPGAVRSASRVPVSSSIYQTDGGVTEKNRWISACAGKATIHQGIGVDEREILSLPGRENRVRITCRAVLNGTSMAGGPWCSCSTGGTERGGTRATHGDTEQGQTRGAQAQSGRKAAGRRRRDRRRERSRTLSRLAGPRFTGPNGASWRATLTSHW